MEFVSSPCGWNFSAPSRLREHIDSVVPMWQDYSTARILGCFNPTILRVVEFTEWEFDVGMQIETLPEALAVRWETNGLRFATEAEMNDLKFPELLARSLGLVHMVDPLLGTVGALCRSLHILLPSDMGFDSSFSDPSLPYSAFVSCPLPVELNRVERLAESVVHEALHLQLSLVEAAEPLVIDPSAERLVWSPWRQEPRTVRGLLHSVYVFGNLRYFWNRIREHFPEYSIFAKGRIEEIDGQLAAARDLVKNPTLTPMGCRLASSLLACF